MSSYKHVIVRYKAVNCVEELHLDVRVADYEKEGVASKFCEYFRSKTFPEFLVIKDIEGGENMVPIARIIFMSIDNAPQEIAEHLDQHRNPNGQDEENGD